MELYIYLFAGILVYVLLGISSFNKQTPTLTTGKTLEQYFSLNKWNLLAGLILGFACISFLSIGKLEFLKSLGFNVLSNPESAFILGIINQWVLQKVRQVFFSSTILETHFDKVKTLNDYEKT